jgi:hypothetical protein
LAKWADETEGGRLGNDAVPPRTAHKAGISLSALLITEQRLLTDPFLTFPSQRVQLKPK